MLMALHQTEGIGWRTIQKLVALFPQLSDVLTWTHQDWVQAGLSQGKANQLLERLQGMNEQALTVLHQQYEEQGVSYVTVWDEAYPELLKQTTQPPWVLYYKGDVDLLQKPCIAMVGTRTPTAYGKKVAEQLAEALAASGLCVVSGLARGIDSCAHEGAVNRQGGTIGVLGCGINQVYPPENKLLFDKMTTRGLILSEYPLNTKPQPGLFPQRNRIIAGLSLGVVVIEAALRSGSLITADQALEESRDVFAVPGPITSPKSQGTLSLLKQGAKLVTSADDITEEYVHRISLDKTAYAKIRQETSGNLTPEEQRIVELLHYKACHIDELLVQSQFTFGHLHSVLLHLQMKKRILELPGSVYTVP
jgi:DNA processing protein